MKIVTLPNGFVLDLESVDYIRSSYSKRHPFTGELLGIQELILSCKGHTTIEIEAPDAHIDEIIRLVLNNIQERVG